jgi:cobalt-zinc-cadmium efflux system membrane fusion protein
VNDLSSLKSSSSSQSTIGRPYPWRIAGIVIVTVAVVATVTLRPWQARVRTEGAQAAPAQPGNFQATEGQWSALGMAPIGIARFENETETDGKIAINDDMATPVYSPFSGRVTKILVKPGDKLAKGAPMLVIEATDVAQAQNDLISAAATLVSAKAQLSQATVSEKRAHDLFEAKGGSLKDWQQAQVDLASAQAAFRSAEIGLGTVRNRLRIFGKSDGEIQSLETTSNTLAMTANAILPAPTAGTVIQRQVGPGEYINSAAAGGNPVFTVGDLSTVWLVANLREADAPNVHLGDAVEVTVLAYPDRLFKGKLTYLAPTVDPNTRRVAVRAEVVNADGALRPEMFATFRILSGDERNSPAVPESAVIYEGSAARVWVANAADKTIALRTFTPGRTHDGQVEVVGGLSPGETLVTKGGLFIDRASKGD